MSKSREQLEAWLKTIEVSGKVLDIGGSQKEILSRTKTWNVSEYKVLDLENPHEVKKKSDISADINDICVFGALYSEYEKYDVVFCLEVSEYWYNPVQAIKNLCELLKQGGILYISFHTLYSLHKPEGLDYMRLTRYGIEKLLTETGFVIEEIIAKPITEEGREALIRFYKAEGMKVLNNEYTFDEGYLIKAIKL